VLLNPFDDNSVHVKTKTSLTYAFLIAANVVAWGWAAIAFADRPTLLSTALLAYTFGLRHAFGADHIAAIDNVVRKLIQDGKHPHSVGFFSHLATRRSSSSSSRQVQRLNRCEATNCITPPRRPRRGLARAASRWSLRAMAIRC
jgi:hypothetical protein